MWIVFIYWVLAIFTAILVIVFAVKKLIFSGKKIGKAMSNLSNYERSSWRIRQNRPIRINYKNYVNGFNKNLLEVRAYIGVDDQNPFTPSMDLQNLRPAISRPYEDIEKERQAFENVKKGKLERRYERNRKYWKRWNESLSWDAVKRGIQNKEEENKEKYGYKNIYEKMRVEKLRELVHHFNNKINI